LFKHKIKAQFNPLLLKNVVSNKSKNTDKSATISALPLPILAKSLEEVVEISKFFKKNPSTKEKKLYAQISFQNTNTIKVFRTRVKVKVMRSHISHTT